MTPYQHPAHTMPFHELLAGLENEVAAKNVNAKDSPDGLRMYAYSDRCVYERAWNAFSLMARGLILDPANERIVATPFTKFFNYGERPMDDKIPDEPFEVFEKLDGSLIIIYYHAGKWNAATRGSFTSDQAKWAQNKLEHQYDASALIRGCTYLAEAIYPENRIVVRYDYEDLVMLSGFTGDGHELDFRQLEGAAIWAGMELAGQVFYNSITDLLADMPKISGNEEGFVLRLASGLRLKFKGDEYRRLHKCIAGVTPLALWEAMKTSPDGSTGNMSRDIPEEFWQDFDTISELLMTRLERTLRLMESEYTKIAELSDKELGLNLSTVAEGVRQWMFPYRKSNGFPMKPGSKLANAIWDSIRPTGNRLDGYRASAAMNRVQTEE